MSNISKNYIYNVAFNIFSMIIPLLTAPYLARILGAEGVGKYSYYFSIAHYFTLFAKMGLTNYGTRYIASIRDNRAVVCVECTNIYMIQCAAVVTVSVFYCIYLFLYAKDFQIAAIFGIWILSVLFDTDWLLFALEEFKIAAIRNGLGKAGAMILIFLTVKDADDIWKYALITVVSYTVGYIFLWVKCRKYLTVSNIVLRYVVQHLKPCLILMIPVIALNVYRTMDKVMLGNLSSMTETGLYEYAEKLVYCLTSFIVSLGTVMMPRMSNLIAKNDKKMVLQYMENSIVFMMFLSSGMCLGLAAIADSLIPILYGDMFLGSIKLLKLLSVTLIFMAWGNVIRTQYVIPGKKDHIYIGSIVTGAVVNVVLNSVLIPEYAAAGACVGTVCAEFSVIVFQTIKLWRELPYVCYLKKSAPFLFFGILMYGICNLIERRLMIGLMTMVVQIVTGGVCYLLFSWIYIRNSLKKYDSGDYID